MTGVRLDDLTAFHAVKWFPRKGQKGFPATKRHESWPSEFDKAGMIRATRYPLGRAAKVYARIGHKDIDGRIIEEGEQGWYYAWYRGLQMLPGAEGAHLYQVRPSFEELRDIKGRSKDATWFYKYFAFNKDFKAVVQAGNGQEYYKDDNSNQETSADDEDTEQIGETG